MAVQLKCGAAAALYVADRLTTINCVFLYEHPNIHPQSC